MLFPKEYYTFGLTSIFKCRGPGGRGVANALGLQESACVLMPHYRYLGEV